MKMSAAALNRSPQPAQRHQKPAKNLNVPRETTYTWIGLVFTLATAIMVERDIDPIIRAAIADDAWMRIADDVALIMIVYYLIFGTILYFACRLGYLKRIGAHRPATRQDLEALYDRASAPLLAILVPSYKEEERVVRQTLMSAALMEYPDRDIVLLIDDPPDSHAPEAVAALARMRRLPRELRKLFRVQEQRFRAELAGFGQRRIQGSINPGRESRHLAKLYRDVAAWLEKQVDMDAASDHTDRLFIKRIMLEPARAHRARAREWEARAGGLNVCEADLLREYRRLAALFAARFTSFRTQAFR